MTNSRVGWSLALSLINVVPLACNKAGQAPGDPSPPDKASGDEAAPVAPPPISTGPLEAVPPPSLAIDATVPGPRVKAVLHGIAALRLPLGSPDQIAKNLGLNPPYNPTGYRRVLYSSFVEGSSWYLVEFEMIDGTWEPSRGNGVDRSSPQLASVAMHGPETVDAPVPADARLVEYLATPVAWDLTSSIPARLGGVGKPGWVHSWGTGHHFMQGSPHRTWYFGFHASRAEFAYQAKELSETEAFLVKVIEGGRDAADIGAWLNASLTDTKVGDGFQRGAARVRPTGPRTLEVTLEIPLPLPKTFAATGANFIETSFAHDYGEMAKAMKGNGLVISPGRYFCEDRDRGSTEGMCDAAMAHWQMFGIQFGDDS